MFVKIHRKSLAAALAVVLATAAGSATGAGLQAATDQGLAPTDQNVTVSLVLRMRNEQGLEQYVQQTATSGSANFQKFLTTAEFANRYGATDTQIAKVQQYLSSHGLKGEVLDNHMVISVNGTLGQFSSLFNTPIHSYVSDTSGQRFHRPAQKLVMPAGLGDSVLVASGLSNERHFVPHHTNMVRTNLQIDQPSASLRTQSLTISGQPGAHTNPTATGIPGSYTVGDVADLYNINPLYARGINGSGSTVAIVTLATFDPADAENYWSKIGLTTKPNRILQVHVDGGGGTNGSDETALDVEQSGGLAPFANIIVYDAPNSGSGFVDAFARAVSDNTADSISTSWGLGEIFALGALNGGNPNDTTDVGDLQAYHQIFMEAAAQGQSMFAASGDSGAYDTVRQLGTGTAPGTYSAPLTVDSPASDPYITAAGGTTVPVQFRNRAGNVVLSIDKERVWGWDYLLPFVPSRRVLGRRWRWRQRLLAQAAVSVLHQRHPAQRKAAVARIQRFVRTVYLSEPARRLRWTERAGYLAQRRPGNRVPDLHRGQFCELRRHQLRVTAAEWHQRAVAAEHRSPHRAMESAYLPHAEHLRLRQIVCLQQCQRRQ
jgi:kumamolisin